MFKKLALMIASASLAVSTAPLTANAQSWHGAHGGYYAPHGCYNCGRPNWGAVAVGAALGYAAANAINGNPGYYAPPPCVRMWDGYRYRMVCNYGPPMPSYNPYGYGRSLPSPCQALAGDRLAGNGVPICAQ